VTQPPVVVRMALAAAQPATAEAAVRRAESFARANAGNVLLEGVAAHARGLCHGRLEDLQEGVRLLRRAGRPAVLAAALEDAADALLADGRRAAALEAAGEASDTWERIGAIADARRMRRRLRALGVHRRGTLQVRPKQGWGSLTESELAVVRLVAEGHTNRQVAQRLVLSPHTVSTHLRHAFTKLKINSRVELARIALDPELREAAAA
jgi:DNA-binding CsgD family transcriptional regulator